MIPLYYNLRSLWARRLSTGLSLLGLALVVFVFAAVLMLANGISTALESGGSPQNVVVLREGSDNEVVSSVERTTVLALSASPELASAPDGKPLIAGELVVLVGLPHAGGTANVTARGVAEESLAVRPSVHLAQGRLPRPGTNEVMIGGALVGRFPGAAVGGELTFGNQRWPVVGRFEAKGSAFESEIWADRDRLASVFTRPTWSSAIMRVASPGEVEPFIARTRADPRFKLKVQRENEYWATQATGLATFIRVLGLFVAFIFAIGAALGAMITMYAQVAARVRELGTLRAVGFRRRSVLASVVVESAILGLAGGALGAICALGMGWVKIHTLNFQTFSDVTFAFVPTPEILIGAMLFGAAMGLAGGLLPALRAARLDILDALRA